MNKLCECGCGFPAPIAKKTNRHYGHTKGQPVRFIAGHFSKTLAHREQMALVDPAKTVHVGPENGNWKGGRRLDAQGYVVVRVDGQEVREHRIIAAQKIGRALEQGEVVHHIDGDKSNNSPCNLEVLPSQSDHMREHMTSEVAKERGAKGLTSRYAALLALASESPTPAPLPIPS